MADDDYDPEDGFDVRQVQTQIAKICQQLFMTNDTPPRPQPFVHAKVGAWTTTLVENVLKVLAEKNEDAVKPDNPGQKYKFVVNAHVQQKVGAALMTACATYGEKALDGVAFLKWESEQIQVQVVVYAMAV